jgi:hypothetical protein
VTQFSRPNSLRADKQLTPETDLSQKTEVLRPSVPLL